MKMYDVTWFQKLSVGPANLAGVKASCGKDQDCGEPHLSNRPCLLCSLSFELPDGLSNLCFKPVDGLGVLCLELLDDLGVLCFKALSHVGNSLLPLDILEFFLLLDELCDILHQDQCSTFPVMSQTKIACHVSTTVLCV